jgi:serine/threonine protein kinase
MSVQRLKCDLDHSWDQPADGLIPEDLRAICPVCLDAAKNSNPSPTRIAPDSSADETQSAPPLSIDGFEILDVITRGGMGVIYKARQLGLNRLVALKVIAPERLGHAETLNRFKREVQAAAMLSHPNIVTVYQTDLQSRQPYLAMEYVAGIDLHKLVTKGGPVAPADACNYILQAARGLQHAFERGLVHRDIKPSNLMVSPSPLKEGQVGESFPKSAGERRIKILDMGLARIAEPMESGELTRAGFFLGTPAFASPEQTESPSKADIRSDLYSLGGTLYFLLTGEAPFPDCNIMEKLRRQLTEPAPSPLARRPDVWPALDAVVKLLMACDPAQRFQTPVELIATLEKAVRDPSASIGSSRSGVAPQLSSPKQIAAHSTGVTALAICPDGSALVSGGLDEALRIWDPVRLCQIRDNAKDAGSVVQVCISPNSKWAASCSLRLFKQDMVVQIWDLSDGSLRGRLRGATDNIRCVAISPDGRRVAAGGSDLTVRVWELDNSKAPPIEFRGHVGPIQSVAFLSGGTVLLSAGDDGTVRLWNSKTGSARATLNADVGRVVAVAHCPISRRLAFAGQDLRILHPDGSFIHLAGHTGRITCIAFSPTGEFLVSGGKDRSVRVWRSEDGRELRNFQGHKGKVTGVVFRPDGKAVYSASADGTIRCWPCVD